MDADDTVRLPAGGRLMDEQLSSGFLRAVLDAIPSPVFIVGGDFHILTHNPAADPLLGEPPTLELHMSGGEALHCIHSTETMGGCGHSEHCQTCVLRNSVQSSFTNRNVVRQKAKMTLVGLNSNSEVYLLVTAAPLQHQGAAYVMLILEDISELVQLRKLIPICANCKRIRNEKQYWDTLESYFKTQMDIDFTHGICPECFERLYPDLAEKWKMTGKPPL